MSLAWLRYQRRRSAGKRQAGTTCKLRAACTYRTGGSRGRRRGTQRHSPSRHARWHPRHFPCPVHAARLARFGSGGIVSHTRLNRTYASRQGQGCRTPLADSSRLASSVLSLPLYPLKRSCRRQGGLSTQIALLKTSTICGSNCVPAQRSISLMASSDERAALYGRSDVIAS